LLAAHAIVARLGDDELSIRVGVHVGDVERRGADIAGVGVHIAARVMDLAEDGEVLVTASVPVAASGTTHQFEAVGERSLKGLTGQWPLFRAIAGNPATSSAAGGTSLL
jgi:class 3 adenylate cyclase